MIIFEGYDISADGPKDLLYTTVEECAAACLETPGCTGFVMVPNDPWSGCFIKDEDFSASAIERDTRRPDTISAVMCDGRLNLYDLPRDGYKYPMEG